jgi:hypothetical protein
MPLFKESRYCEIFNHFSIYQSKFIFNLFESKAAKRCILITGTPALSRPNELFTQLDMVLSSKMTWMDKYQFGRRYCDAKDTNFGFEDKGASNLHELNYLLTRTVMLRRLKDEVLTDLPPKVREHVYVTIEDKYRSELQRGLKNIGEFSSNIGKAQSLSERQDKQFDSNREWMSLFQLSGEAKLKSVINYVENLLECKQKFLIFAHHLAILDGIEKFVKKAKVKYMRIDGSTKTFDRQKHTETFQKDPECIVAILSMKAAGTGLTLHAASHVIFAELMWNPGELFQAEDRVHRVGQKHSVTITYLLGKETLDEIVWDKISKKLDVVENSLNGITNTDLIDKRIDIDESNNMKLIQDKTISQTQFFEDDDEDDEEILESLNILEKEIMERKNKQIKRVKKTLGDVQITSENMMDFIFKGGRKKLPFNVTHDRKGKKDEKINSILLDEEKTVVESKIVPKIIVSEPVKESPVEKEKITKRKLFQTGSDEIVEPLPIEKKRKIETIQEEQEEIIETKNKPKSVSTSAESDALNFLSNLDKYQYSPVKESPLSQERREKREQMERIKALASKKPKTKVIFPRELQKDLDL